MNKFMISFLIGCGLVMCQSSPLSSSEEGSSLIQKQAQQNYNHHQEVIQGKDYSSASKADSNNGYNADGSFGITFDNHNKEHRDRGYGYEKAYAYSRETAFFDFYDDKGALNAKDLVETSGGAGDHKDEDLLKNIAN